MSCRIILRSVVAAYVCLPCNYSFYGFLFYRVFVSVVRKLRPGARFSKVPKLFGHISGRIILFVCSKRKRLEARNFAVILIYIPFTTYEKTSFTELAGRSFTNSFSGPKCCRNFRETGPGSLSFRNTFFLSYTFLSQENMSPTN